MTRSSEPRGEELRRRILFRLLRPTVHRLNNDLAVLSGLSELLLHGETNPERRESLSAIAERAHEATRLWRSLAALTLDAEELQPADVDAAVRDAERVLSPATGAARTEMEVSTRPDELPAASDPRTLRLLLVGLASALVQQATPGTALPGGRLRIATRSARPRADGTARVAAWIAARLPEAESSGDPGREEYVRALELALDLSRELEESSGAEVRVRWLGARVCGVALTFAACSG